MTAGACQIVTKDGYIYGTYQTLEQARVALHILLRDHPNDSALHEYRIALYS